MSSKTEILKVDFEVNSVKCQHSTPQTGFWQGKTKMFQGTCLSGTRSETGPKQIKPDSAKDFTEGYLVDFSDFSLKNAPWTKQQVVSFPGVTPKKTGRVRHILRTGRFAATLRSNGQALGRMLLAQMDRMRSNPSPPKGPAGSRQHARPGPLSKQELASQLKEQISEQKGRKMLQMQYERDIVPRSDHVHCFILVPASPQAASSAQHQRTPPGCIICQAPENPPAFHNGVW